MLTLAPISAKVASGIVGRFCFQVLGDVAC